MDQMAQLKTGLLLFASAFGSAGGKVWRIFGEGTSNRLPRIVGSLSLRMQPKLRGEA